MYKLEGFSLDIFKQRYAYNDSETWEKACERVASQMAKAESPDKYEKYKQKFYEELVTNRFCPGGRIWYNSGRPNPQLLNCFVLTNELDTREGWGKISHDMIVTSMTGGGCGIDFTDVRPNNAEIKGQKGTCPGPLSLMELIDANGKPVRAGGARRVALMFGLDLFHPDIEAFVTAKSESLSENSDPEAKFSKANFSVLVPNMAEFIEAVKSDGELELSWKGKYKRKIKAKPLWDKIVENAYISGDPGILNMDLANYENTVYYAEDLVISNPCGEIIMTPNESCCLGHLVLPRFVKNGKIDRETLGETIRYAVRFLDNVLSVNNYPLPQMKAKAEKYRRIGLGTTGLADMLALLGLKYGSKDANQFLDKLYRFISKKAYEASIMLALEKGSFPECEPENHLNSGYVKRMTPYVKSILEDHGIRNCCIMTIAPVGTGSILSGNISSGIEPMFAPAYVRKFWKGEEKVEETVFHPLFMKFMEEGKSVDHFVGSADLSPKEHFEVQKILQKHIDGAISKTINLPADYSQEDMSKLWLEYLPFVKGTTFYRDGSKEDQPLTPISLKEAKKRFKKGGKEAVIEQKCKGGVCDL